MLTVLAAVLGLLFSFFISTGITTPVRRLLDGTRAVEAGRLDGSIDVTTKDEIGQLTAAFNNMVEQLRHKERLRETFGSYVDPRVVEGLIDPKSLTASDGERRVMTVLFCDMKGFTGLSEGMTPQGLVKVMNHYLSTMSGPIRSHRGIIDKYIGDAIMAYWGPPFTEDGEQAQLACLAAVEMAQRGVALRTELPELLGVRTIPSDCTIRIGIATGEVLVGSIGSEFMMSYTVMGDAVNLASRLEGANKIYGSHFAGLGADDRGRRRRGRISRDRPVGRGRPDHAEAVFEIMGRKDELDEKQLRCASTMPRGSPPIAPAVGTTRVRRSMRRSMRFPATGRRWRWPGASRSFRPIRRPRIGTARGASTRNSALRYAARKSSTISQNFCGACSNIGCVAPGIISVREPVTCAASACSTFGSTPLVLAPPMNNVGVLIASASALENGGRWSLIWPISVVALSRSSCFGVAGSRFQAPGPSSASMKISSPPSMSPLGDDFGGGRDPRRQRRGAGLVVGVERGIEFAAGFGQDQSAQQVRPPLGDAEADMPAAGMAHQVDRSGVQLLDEGDDVVDMLRDRIGVADAVPMIGKEMPQATARSRGVSSTADPAPHAQIRKSHSEPCTQTSGGPSPSPTSR